MMFLTIASSYLLACVLVIATLSMITSGYCVYQPNRDLINQYCHRVTSFHKVFFIVQLPGPIKDLMLAFNKPTVFDELVMKLGRDTTIPMSLAGVVFSLSLLLWFGYLQITSIVLFFAALRLIPQRARFFIKLTVVGMVVLASVLGFYIGNLKITSSHARSDAVCRESPARITDSPSDRSTLRTTKLIDSLLVS